MADFDVGIIGGGPGGYVAAIRAAQLGKSVVLFEKERVGGLCLNWGCIPSKALLRNADVVSLVRNAAKWGIGGVENATFDFGAAVDRSRKVVDQLVSGVEGLLKENGVTTVNAEARFKDANTIVAGDKDYSVDNAIIAAGVASRALPGVEIDGNVVMTSREAIVLKKVPERAVIIGAGPVGVEFAHMWASYGAHVTIVEMLDTLVPLEDPDIGRLLQRSFQGRGIDSLVKTKVESVKVDGASATVSVSADGGTKQLSADVVLVAIGFVGKAESLGIDGLGIATERGLITIDDQMRTNVPNVYAIGDITGKLMLAHVGMQQGVIAAEAIAGKQTPPLDYVQMPRATFCQPQIGSIGYTEAQARKAGYRTRTGRFPLTALGKAIAMGETEGFVKVVADEKTGQVLGIHMIGHDINDVLGEGSLAALLEATTVEVGFAVHAHPTLAEALKEAALAVDGEAIHIARRRSVRPAQPQGVAAT